MTTTGKRNLTYGLGALALIVTGYYLFFNGDNGGATEDPTGNGSIGDANSGIGGFNAKNIANGLYNAMKEMGTNESRILQLLTHVNQEQFGKVFAAFGRKSYNKNLGNQYNFDPFSDLPLENLQVWLENELSETDYEVLRSKYPSYL